MNYFRKRSTQLNPPDREDRLLRRIWLLLVIISASALAQTAPIKTTLIKAGPLLDVKAGVYLTNQGVLIVGDRIKEVGAFDAINELKRVKFVMKGGETVKYDLSK